VDRDIEIAKQVVRRNCKDGISIEKAVAELAALPGYPSEQRILNIYKENHIEAKVELGLASKNW